MKQIYTKFRYQGNLYAVGDDIMLSDGNNGFYIAKITKLIPKGGISTYKNWPTIQVQWYYAIKDIRPKISLNPEDISDNERILSNHFENVIIESIISKCSVLSLEKYEQLGSDDLTFFTRATYNIKTVRIFINKL